jgi:hypothetical protein
MVLATPQITPCPQKGPKKTYEIFFIAQLKGNKKILVGFFGPFLGTGREMPKRCVLAFGITPNTQHTNCNTLPALHRPVFLPGSSLASFGKSRLLLGETGMGPRHRQNGGQRRERHLGRSWWSLQWHLASSGRALLPAVRHSTKPAKSSDAKKSICA